MVKEGLSLVDIASIVLTESKEPMNLYDLFDEILKRKELEVEDKASLLTSFYADLTVSAKFVYTGDNCWDLKSNQKIELWEKDGSYYKEYTKIDLPEEYLEKEKPKAAAPVAKAPVAKKVVEEVKEEVVETAPEVKEEVVETTPELVAEPAVDPAVQQYEEQAADEFEEDLFEDDFDEDKYNEYMDTYEDQYDD